MSEVSNHLELLLKQRDTPLWAGYVNMLKTLESVFQSSIHWVLEFLQNAEDANAERVLIKLGEGHLTILNSGDVFSQEDFEAICDVNSRKLPSLGFRGYLGIGFKSIFRIASQVQVHSGEYHFEFGKNQWRDWLQQEGVSLANHPWEILPVEVAPDPVRTGYTTLFHIPLKDETGREILSCLEEFFTRSDFPKEAILLLKNVSSIAVETRNAGFEITKSIEQRKEEAYGAVELAAVQKYAGGRLAQSRYLVTRKIVPVPSAVQQDEETERVRRSDVKEREIGLVFGFGDGDRPVRLQGNLAGVYSFLPVEGEQTGLPFGIFGDYIPQPGRDLINYGAAWNAWISEELVTLFKDVLRTHAASEAVWQQFSAELLASLRTSTTTGPGEPFWKSNLREPIENFLNVEPLFPDSSGVLRTVGDLVHVEDQVLGSLGPTIVEKVTDKRIAQEGIYRNLQGVISQFDIRSIVQETLMADISERLKPQPGALAGLYMMIQNVSDYYIKGGPKKDGGHRHDPLYQVQFVLGHDGELHRPERVMMLEIDLQQMPRFLRTIVPEGKTALHPEVATNADAVAQLQRCGMEKLDKRRILALLTEKVNGIRSAEDIPTSWSVPDDVVAAAHFIVAEAADGALHIDQVLTQQESFERPRNLFVPGATLDWMPLYKADLLPGWHPMHNMYLRSDFLQRHGIQREKMLFYLEELGAHGFEAADDRQLIDTAAMAKSKMEVRKVGHHPEDVARHDEVGYDLECQGHCNAVFEVKGMGQPRDQELPPSETRAARQRGKDYHLVFVYNIPNTPDNLGYKVVKDPAGCGLLEAVDRSRIRRDRWIND